MQVNDQLTLTAPTANTSLFAYRAQYLMLLQRRPRAQDEQEKLKLGDHLQRFLHIAARLEFIQCSCRPSYQCSPRARLEYESADI